MEHNQALEMNAPDRYVLGQLSAAEADAFEEHFFDCPACADDVRLGMTIMEGGRHLVRQGQEPETPVAPVVPIGPRGRWGRWIPAAAVAAVMAIPVNVALLMRMQNAAPVASFGAVAQSVELDPTRGAEHPPITIEQNSTFSFAVPLDDVLFAQYEARLLDSAGNVITSDVFNEQQAADGRSASIFNAGQYQLLIFGIGPNGQSREIARRAVIVTAPKQ